MIRTAIKSLAVMSLLAISGAALAQSDVPTVIVDADSGEVLEAEAATRPWYPASTTKLMTAYVALREVEKGSISFDTPIVASANAQRQPPSKIGIRPGQEITLGNALKILMVKSANDIAVVVAEGVGGTVPGFSALMNREAARLGMHESHFVNPHGLHRAEHVSSARDMAILARALLKEFPQYRALWGIGAVQLGNRKYANTNGLIGRYPGSMGMKTGFVCASGFNLVSAAERGGRTLIAVVFGASSGADRTLKAAQLLDQGFNRRSSGSGSTLYSLTASAETQAPNRRSAICGRRSAPSSEEDTGGAISFSVNLDDPNNIMNPGRAVYSGSNAQSVGTQTGGRISLGPRAPLEAISVHLGREPGSTEVARRPGGGGTKAQAFANEPNRAAASAGRGPLALTQPLKRPGAAARISGKNAPARPAQAASLHRRKQANLPQKFDAPKAGGKAAESKASGSKGSGSKASGSKLKVSAKAARKLPRKAAPRSSASGAGT